MSNKKISVEFRVTAEEKQILKDYCQQEKITMTDLFKERVLNYIYSRKEDK